MQLIGESALALAMIAAIVLIFVGVRLMMGSVDRKRGVLMVIAALVLIANVLIWTV
jgi:hypothetical protein